MKEIICGLKEWCSNPLCLLACQEVFYLLMGHWEYF